MQVSTGHHYDVSMTVLSFLGVLRGIMQACDMAVLNGWQLKAE